MSTPFRVDWEKEYEATLRSESTALVAVFSSTITTGITLVFGSGFGSHKQYIASLICFLVSIAFMRKIWKAVQSFTSANTLKRQISRPVVDEHLQDFRSICSKYQPDGVLCIEAAERIISSQGFLSEFQKTALLRKLLLSEATSSST